MKPIRRRTALTLGGLGVAATLVGGSGLWRGLSATGSAGSGGQLVEPQVVSSSNGQLEVRLQARFGTHQVAGQSARTMGYNGSVPGPTLRLRPGDTLRIALDNQLDHVTNLHLHGLHFRGARALADRQRMLVPLSVAAAAGPGGSCAGP